MSLFRLLQSSIGGDGDPGQVRPGFHIPNDLDQQALYGALGGLLVGAGVGIGVALLRENNIARFPLSVPNLLRDQELTQLFDRLLPFRPVDPDAYDALLATMDQVCEIAMLAESEYAQRSFGVRIRRFGNQALVLFARFEKTIRSIDSRVLQTRYRLKVAQWRELLPQLGDELRTHIVNMSHNTTLGANEASRSTNRSK